MATRWTLLISLAFGLLVGNPGSAAEAKGDSWAEVQAAKKGKITVVYRPGAPWAMTDKDGELSGFEIELFRYFLNYLHSSHGVSLEVAWVPEERFPVLYSTVQEGSGGVFGLSKVTILESRRSEVGFSAPYLNNVPVLVTHESLGELTSLKALQGYTGLTLKGTSMESAMLDLMSQGLPDLELEYLERSADICYRIASAESHSFAVLDLMSTWKLIDALPIRRQTIGLGEHESYGIIVPLGSDWLAPLADFLEGERGRLRSTPTYYRLLQRYFGNEIADIVREVGIE